MHFRQCYLCCEATTTKYSDWPPHLCYIQPTPCSSVMESSQAFLISSANALACFQPQARESRQAGSLYLFQNKRPSSVWLHLHHLKLGTWEYRDPSPSFSRKYKPLTTESDGLVRFGVQKQYSRCMRATYLVSLRFVRDVIQAGGCQVPGSCGGTICSDRATLSSQTSFTPTVV